MENNSTANQIFQQLGGGRFAAMVGMKNAVHGKNFLMFSIGKAKDGINKVRVTLEPTDTYKVEFFRLRGVDCRQIASTDMVYADSLREVFTSYTGLLCTM